MKHVTRTVLMALVLLGTPAFAQDSPPAPPRQDDPKKDEAKKDDAAKSLDELLGLEEDDSSRGAAEAAEREARDALDRALRAKEISDNFRDAIRQMGVSAELLGEKFDAGLGTQRVQEEIIRKLDDLIASARKEQSSSSSSSSSQSSSQQNRQQPRQQQQNNQQSPSDQNDSSRNNNPADSTQSNAPTQQPEGELKSLLAEGGVEWGSLPERVRDQLMQAMRDQPSALYRRLTQEYYRRLAEESSN